jgi:hypothetical protein
MHGAGVWIRAAEREGGRQGGREAGRQGGREAGREGGRESQLSSCASSERNRHPPCSLSLHAHALLVHCCHCGTTCVQGPTFAGSVGENLLLPELREAENRTCADAGRPRLQRAGDGWRARFQCLGSSPPSRQDVLVKSEKPCDPHSFLMHRLVRFDDSKSWRAGCCLGRSSV